MPSARGLAPGALPGDARAGAGLLVLGALRSALARRAGPGRRRLPPLGGGAVARGAAMGVSRATFDAGLQGRRARPVAARPGDARPGEEEVKGQAEFIRTPASICMLPTSPGSPSRAGRCSPSTARRSPRSRARSACSRQVVLAIWGRETAFGAHKSAHYAIRALATQAYSAGARTCSATSCCMRSSCSRTAS